jgi:hypothetical protein
MKIFNVMYLMESIIVIKVMFINLFLSKVVASFQHIHYFCLDCEYEYALVYFCRPSISIL